MKSSEFDVFVAPDSAFRAFEEAVLAAENSVLAGFRVFDMQTQLVSDAAREIGETWFDLLAHVIARGVRFELIISDFDPVYAAELHRSTWKTVRDGDALVEATGAPKERVIVRPSMHPMTPGLVPWLAFLPETMRRALRIRGKLSESDYKDAPGFKTRVPRMHPVTHHQKLAVIDDETLYIGGLDLNDRRFDTIDHERPAHETWSDVQVMLRNDPAVAEAKRHLETFEAVIHRKAEPTPMTHLRRTLSAERRLKFPFLSPRTLLSEIEETHLNAIRDARHLIHIETQYMRSRRVADALAEAAQARDELGLIMILPALPEEVAFMGEENGLDSRYGLALEKTALSIIREGFGERAIIACPVRPVMAARETRGTRAGSPIIYVHNKVLVQDRAFAMVGSGNLNGRSLRWDTEVSLAINESARIEPLRAALYRHWWRKELTGDWADPQKMLPLWRDEVLRNDVRQPENRAGFLVSHDTSVHASDGVNIPMVTDDIV